MNTHDRVKAYARQRGTKHVGKVGWGINPTPKQRRRLQKKHTRWIIQLVKGRKD